MSQDSIQEKIRRNPKFSEMVGKRTRFAITLTLIVLIPYYIFMMVTAFYPNLLAQPIGTGVMTFGWPIAALMILGSWITTGLYVRRANSEFDALNEQILKESQK